MDRWLGKLAIVTGATAGIGEAISKSLVNHGVKVAGLARRQEKLDDMTKALGKDKFYAIQCDVQKEEDILKAFERIDRELGGADILVNNAGVAARSLIIDTPTSEYRKLVDTNLMAPAICARKFTQSIRKRDVPGHIININSIAGLYAEALSLPIGMYAPTKYGLRALGTELRHEFIEAKLRIKVTNISPGIVFTELFQKMAQENPKAVENWPMLKSQDIAEAAMYALGTPDGVEVYELTIAPQNATIIVKRKTG